MAKDEEVLSRLYYKEFLKLLKVQNKLLIKDLNSYSNTVSKVNNYAAEIAPISIYKAQNDKKRLKDSNI